MATGRVIIIPENWEETFAALPDRELAALIRAAFSAARGEEPPPMRGGAAVIWPLFRALITQNNEKYEEICRKRKAAADARWNARQDTNAQDDDANECNSNAENAIASKCNKIAENAIASSCNAPVCHTKSKSKSKSNNNIPPNPLERGKRSEGDIKKRWIVRSVGRYFRRRGSTAWSRKETAALAGIVARPDALRECREILMLYRDPAYQFQRRDIITLLNNWPGELDRARNHKPQMPPPRAGRPGPQISEPLQQFTKNERGLRR